MNCAVFYRSSSHSMTFLTKYYSSMTSEYSRLLDCHVTANICSQVSNIFSVVCAIIVNVTLQKSKGHNSLSLVFSFLSLSLPFSFFHSHFSQYLPIVLCQGPTPVFRDDSQIFQQHCVCFVWVLDHSAVLSSVAEVKGTVRAQELAYVMLKSKVKNR